MHKNGKRLALALSIALSFVVVPFVAVNASSPKCITLYEHINFQGASKKICASSVYIGDNFNDKVSSMKIDASVGSVTLYQHRDYQGKKFTLPGGIEESFVGPRFNDIISSVKFH